MRENIVLQVFKINQATMSSEETSEFNTRQNQEYMQNSAMQLNQLRKENLYQFPNNSQNPSPPMM